MSNFTPGKWEADEAGEYVFTRTPFNKEMVAQMRGWSYLTGKGHGGLHLSSEEAIEVQKANARLIAAAPEMYRELILAMASLRDGGITAQRLGDEIEALLVRIDGEADDE